MPQTPALQPPVRESFPVLKELNESLPSARSVNLMQAGGSQSGQGDAQALVHVQDNPARSLMEQSNTQSNQLAAAPAVVAVQGASSAPSVQERGSTQIYGSGIEAIEKIRMSEEGRAQTFRKEHPKFPDRYPQRLTADQYQQLSGICVCRGMGCLNVDRGQAWVQSTGVKDVPKHFWLNTQQKHCLNVKLKTWLQNGVQKDSIKVRPGKFTGRPGNPHYYAVLPKQLPRKDGSAAVLSSPGGPSISAAGGVQHKEKQDHHGIPLGPRAQLPLEKAGPIGLASEVPANVTRLVNNMVDQEAAKAKAVIADAGSGGRHEPLYPASCEGGVLEGERQRLDAKLQEAKQSLGALLQDIHFFHAQLRGGHDGDGGLEEGEISERALPGTAPGLTFGNDVPGRPMESNTPSRPSALQSISAGVKDVATSSPFDRNASQNVSPIRQNRKRTNSDAFQHRSGSTDAKDPKTRRTDGDQIVWKDSANEKWKESENASRESRVVVRLPNADNCRNVGSSDSYRPTAPRYSLLDDLQRKIAHVQNQLDKLEGMKKDFKNVETELTRRLCKEVARTRQEASSRTENTNAQREVTFYQRLNNLQWARESRSARSDEIGRLTPPRDSHLTEYERNNTQRPDRSLSDRSRSAWTHF